jgi:hypothetical protein
MVQLNLALKEINCKVVYFGPGLSGKTTNLEVVHEKAPKDSRGDLTSIATESDRTLFFDFMPLNLGTVGGMKTKFQLYTVPGQVYYNSTRKLVLRGADGVVFVADSSPRKVTENLESLANLEECLQEQGRSLKDVPHVIQLNKRDLPDALPVEELGSMLNKHGAPVLPAVASKGEGVVETFKILSGLVLDRVKRMSDSKQAARRTTACVVRPAEREAARTPEIPIAAVPVEGETGTAPRMRSAPEAPASARIAVERSQVPHRSSTTPATPVGAKLISSKAHGKRKGESSRSRPIVPVSVEGARRPAQGVYLALGMALVVVLALAALVMRLV